jgi:hypothetical protein
MAEKDNHYYAIGWVLEGNIEDHYGTVKALWLKYKVGTLYNESNADKGLAATQFRKYEVVTQVYHERENKHVKIIGHLYRDWKKIIWSHDTDTKYMAQIVEYQEGQEPDDAPDSAACMCRQFYKKDGLKKIKMRGF